MTIPWLASKCVLLYLIALIPLLRQLPGYDSYHIGNMSSFRVAGLSLPRIFFAETGFPIPMLSLSLQYDLFGSDIRRFKLFHVLFIAALTPLVFLFVAGMTGSEPVALAAATLYGISFNFPINLNWLVQPEHYELFCTLLGGVVAIAGIDARLSLVACCGALLLGLSQLCKMPALLSVWTVGYLCYARTPEPRLAFLLAGCYLAPALCYLVTKAVAFRSPRKQVVGLGNNNIFSRTFGYYYYRYQSDPKAYVKSMFTDRAKDYLAQHLPLVFLASLFLFRGDGRQPLFLGLTILFLSSIFLMRMTLWYTQSVTVMLCLAAAYGLALVRAGDSNVQLLVLCITVLVSYRAITRFPSFKNLFGGGERPVPLQGIASYVAQKLAPGEGWFFNINNGYSYVYLLAGRGFPGFFSHVLMGAYGPKIETAMMPPDLFQQGADIVQVFCSTPPRYVVQSPHEYPIINLFYLELAYDIAYQVDEVHDDFVIYRLADGQQPRAFAPEKFDAKLLFDGELARRMMFNGVTTHMSRLSAGARAR